MEINKFKKHQPNQKAKKLTIPKAVLFSDEKKIGDLEMVTKTLSRNSALIYRQQNSDHKIRKICKENKIKFIVKNNIALYKDMRADGIHFSDNDTLSASLRYKIKKLPNSTILSLSCHNLKSLTKAIKLQPDIIFISPVFPTTSHPNSKIIGIKKLASLAQHFQKLQKTHPKPQLYALGGINLSNIKSLKKLNLGGIGGIDIFLT